MTRSRATTMARFRAGTPTGPRHNGEGLLETHGRGRPDGPGTAPGIGSGPR